MSSTPQTLMRTEHYLSALTRGHVGSQTMLPEPVIHLLHPPPVEVQVVPVDQSAVPMAPWVPESSHRIQSMEKWVTATVLLFFACGVVGVLGRL